MYTILAHVVCVSVLVLVANGDKGGAGNPSCPVKCDLLQEMTLMRQALNQESILRMGLTNELYELKKKVAENEQSINRTQVEANASNNKFAEVQNRQKATYTRLTDVSNAVTRAQNTITAIRNGNTNNKRDLTRLENTLASFNQTLQGNVQYMYV